MCDSSTSLERAARKVPGNSGEGKNDCFSTSVGFAKQNPRETMRMQRIASSPSVELLLLGTLTNLRKSALSCRVYC